MADNNSAYQRQTDKEIAEINTDVALIKQGHVNLEKTIQSGFEVISDKLTAKEEADSKRNKAIFDLINNCPAKKEFYGIKASLSYLKIMVVGSFTGIAILAGWIYLL